MKNIENSVDHFMDMLPCKAPGEYPPIKVECENEHYARLLMNAYAGAVSEYTAIAQYIYHHITIDEEQVAQTELCIALVEMRHLGMLGDLIEQLGGDPKFKDSRKEWWNAKKVAYGDDLCDKLDRDIDAEANAIDDYEKLLCEIDDPYIQAIIRRIIEDEKVHYKTLTYLYNKYCSKKCCSKGCNCRE